MSHTLLVFLASLLSTFGGGLGSRGLEGPSDLVAPRGSLHFFFENRRDTLAVELFDSSSMRGAGVTGVLPAALAELSHFVRCYRTDRERPIHPRLAEIVARTAEAFGREDVDVISGYRARPYGAPHSKHFLGRAMDLHLPGVPSRIVAAWVWRNFRGVGVGVYPAQDFVHIDVRDVDVRWVDSSRHGESNHARYMGRTGTEPVPAWAPRLAYDVQRSPQPRSVEGALATFSLVPGAVNGGFRGRD